MRVAVQDLKELVSVHGLRQVVGGAQGVADLLLSTRVSMTTGMSARPGVAFQFGQNRQPSMVGMATSRAITEGLICGRAESPLPAGGGYGVESLSSQQTQHALAPLRVVIDHQDRLRAFRAVGSRDRRPPRQASDGARSLSREGES